AGGRGAPTGRDGDDLLPLEIEVRRDGRAGREAAEGARRRESAAEADGRRLESRPAGCESGDPKKMVKPAAYRQAVGFVMAEFSLSLRRACRALGFARSSWHYTSRVEPPAALIEKLRKLASRRPRWGYRMLHLMLKRDGVVANHK